MNDSAKKIDHMNLENLSYEERLIADLSMKIVNDLECQVRERSTKFEHLPPHIVLSIYASVSASLPLKLMDQFMTRMEKMDNFDVVKPWIEDIEYKISLMKKGYGVKLQKEIKESEK